MPVITMPDGQNVAFPDDMPRGQIDNLIRQRHPELFEDPRTGSSASVDTAAEQSNPVDVGRSLQVGAQATGKGLLHAVLGLPDLAAGFSNALLGAVDFGAEQLGGNVDFRFGIPSNDVLALADKGAEKLGISDLIIRDKDLTPSERFATGAIDFGTAALAGGGAVSKLAEKGVTKGAPLVDNLIQGLNRGMTPGKVRPQLGNAVAGLSSGAAVETGKEHLPQVFNDPTYGPVAQVLAAVLGGVGGAGVFTAGDAALSAAGRGAKAFTGQNLERGLPMNAATGRPFTKTEMDAAALSAQASASHPNTAAANIGEAAADLRQFNPDGTALPPTGALSKDVGFAMAENARRVKDPVPFVEQEQRTQSIARQAVEDLAPRTDVRTERNPVTRQETGTVPDTMRAGLREMEERAVRTRVETEGPRRIAAEEDRLGRPLTETEQRDIVREVQSESATPQAVAGLQRETGRAPTVEDRADVVADAFIPKGRRSEEAPARAFTDRAEQIPGERQAVAQDRIESAQGNIDAVNRTRTADAEPVRAAAGLRDEAARGIDDAAIEGNLRPNTSESSRRFANADPDKRARVDVDSLIDVARRVEQRLGDLNTPDRILPRGLLARIRNTTELDEDGNPTGPSETTIGDLVEAVPEISKTADMASKTDKPVLARNLRELREGINRIIDEAAEANNLDTGRSARIARANEQGFRGVGYRVESDQTAFRDAGGSDLDGAVILTSSQARARELSGVRRPTRLRVRIDPQRDVVNVRERGEPAPYDLDRIMEIATQARADGRDAVVIRGMRGSPSDTSARPPDQTVVFNQSAMREEGDAFHPTAAGRGGERASDPIVNDPQRRATGEAAARAVEARNFNRDTVQRDFGSGEAEKLRRDFNRDRVDRSNAPPSQTAPRMLQPGKPERAAQLRQIIDNSATPEAGREATRTFLMSDMARAGILDTRTNVIRPDALRRWRDRWGDSLEAAPGFRDQINGLLDRARRGERLTGQFAADLRQAENALTTAQKNSGALGLVIGRNPVNAVRKIFSPDGDPERAMDEILATVGSNARAKAGLKTAIRDFFIEQKTNNAPHKTSDGKDPVNFAQLNDLFKTHEKTLAKIFSPNEMQSLRVAHKFLEPLKQAELQGTRGAATGERNAAFWKAAEIGLKAKYGILKGGGVLRTLKLWADTMPSNKAAVDQLTRQMTFDPELAQHLLTRKLGDVNTAQWNAKLNRLLSLDLGIREQDNLAVPEPTGPEQEGSTSGGDPLPAADRAEIEFRSQGEKLKAIDDAVDALNEAGDADTADEIERLFNAGEIEKALEMALRAKRSQ